MIVQGNCLEVLPTLPDQSVQCCVTSPPYWGLRDYGTAQWEGGEEGCDHKQGRPGAGRADGIIDDRAQRNRDGVGSMGGDCKRCGAKRIDKQIGLESTPGAYVQTMVQVFREVKRVLKDDGTCWINLGDSYATGTKAPRQPTTIEGPAVPASWSNRSQPERCGTPEGLKTKDLVGIPWMVAFALRADGWYLRSDIIWAKPNPMPESVTDRPTKSHEYLFLFAKSEKYFYDAHAIAESCVNEKMSGWNMTDTRTTYGEQNGGNSGLRDLRRRYKEQGLPETRNKRSVWTIATQPYAEAHFATFPPKLIEPCILAGSRPGDTVLDPFAGAGTTLLVAKELNRQYLGIELNPSYIELISKRMAQEVLPL